jgi:isoamylase
MRDKALFEVLLDTALTHGQPTEGSFHPQEEPYPAQGRSLVLLRHRRSPPS